MHIKPPSLPLPPAQYDPQYFHSLLRTLNAYFQQLGNEDALSGTSLALSGLQSHEVGLAAGAAFLVDGVLRVVSPTSFYTNGFRMTASVGTVTVTIT